MGVPRTAPLVCRVGSYLGWWQSVIGSQMIPCPSVCFYETPSREFAEQLLVELGYLQSLGYHDHTPLVHFETRFGFVSEEGITTGETASIRRCMAKVQANEEPPVEYAMQAKLIGHRAFQVTQELAEAWPEDDAAGSAATPDAPRSVENDTGESTESVSHATGAGGDEEKTNPRNRNVPKKTEEKIEQAIRAMPSGSTQTAVADKANVHPKTVASSVAWLTRRNIWGTREHPSSSSDDPDSLLDVKNFIDAKKVLLHHKTLGKVERLMDDPDKGDRLLASLLRAYEELMIQYQTVDEVPDAVAKEVIRSAAETADADKCPA